MKTNLRELYQEMILDHGRNPRSFYTLPTANRQAEGFNQLCGDRLTLFLHIKDSTIHEISFKGAGCAISIASASLMAETLRGKTEIEAKALFHAFHQLLTGDPLKQKKEPRLGKCTIFSGVRAYPVRIKCATLAWHALLAALNHQHELISTEN